MKFETAYKIMELAEVKTVHIFWYGRETFGKGIDVTTEWECVPEDIPYFVGALDVHSMTIIDNGSAGVEAQLFMFLIHEQTVKLWERIEKLA